MVVEPSGIATDWAGSSMQMANIPDRYAATVGAGRRWAAPWTSTSPIPSASPMNSAILSAANSPTTPTDQN